MNSRTLIVALVIAAGLLAGGCGGGRLMVLETPDDFRNLVVSAQAPVAVMFSKAGCPACGSVEPKLASIEPDYTGRVTFARFELVAPFGRITSREILDDHQIAYLPTVIVFAKGREISRWVGDKSRRTFRKGLDEIAGPPLPPQP